MDVDEDHVGAGGGDAGQGLVDVAGGPDHVDQALAYSNAETEARQQKRGLWPMWLGETK